MEPSGRAFGAPKDQLRNAERSEAGAGPGYRFAHPGYACLCNLEAVVGKGLLAFIAFPLRIRSGTAGPIRAVAMFEG